MSIELWLTGGVSDMLLFMSRLPGNHTWNMFGETPWWRHQMETFSALLAICHYIDVTMTTMASQITSLTVVYSTVYSDADQRKHQSSQSPALCVGNSPGPHKGPVTRKMFPFDDVIMVRGIHRSPVNSPHRGQWREALMFSLMTSSNGNIFRVTGPLCGEFTMLAPWTLLSGIPLYLRRLAWHLGAVSI